MARDKKMAEETLTAKKKKRLTKKQKQQRKLIIFGVEVLCLLLLLGLLYVWSLWSKINVESDMNDSEAGINEDLGDDTLNTLEGYTNIALFGLDNRGNGKYDRGNSDVIMVASINNKTKEVRIVSVYRDTYLNVGSGKYNKANSAYARGGAQAAVQMLNTNLDLNIKEYMCVDWGAVTEAVDALGGVEVDITEQERKLINEWVVEVDYYVGTTSPKIKEAGLQTLNGAQATTYARLRKTAGNDFKRTSRQRIVLEAMLNKAKQSDIGTLLDICEAVFDDVSTSLDLKEIIGLARHVKEYTIGSTSGFPFEMTTKELAQTNSTVVPIGLEDDVAMLHKYLFDTEDYQPSKTVQVISQAIIDKTGVSADASGINVDEFNDTAGQSGTVFKDDESTEED